MVEVGKDIVGFLEGHTGALRRQPGFVTLYSPFDNTYLPLLLDEESPRPSGDFGGWESVAVPRKRPVRYWSTNPEAKLELQVIVEANDVLNVTQQLRKLRELGTGNEDRRPRQVELSGQLPPLPVERWVIDDVTWGDALYSTGSLNVIRQRLTILFGEPPTLDAIDVKRQKRSPARTGKGKKVVRYARIRKNETLQEFAARTLGNPARWKEIADLAKPKIRDPRKVRDGRKLRLP